MGEMRYTVISLDLAHNVLDGVPANHSCSQSALRGKR